MSKRNLAGSVIIVLGVFLLIAGLDASDSLSSRISRLFNGSPTDRTLWLFLGGVVAVMVGASMVWRRPSQKA